MTTAELVALSRGETNVVDARQIGRRCPVGHFVVHAHATKRVFYRHAHSDTEIVTEFTPAQVDIASREFPSYDPDFLQWDMHNSTAYHGFDFYLAKGK